MQLYDTARKNVVPFEPRGHQVSMYVCGITPYDAAHLGHAYTYHVFDVLARRLRALGHEVVYVRNITDIDDDIFRVSRERGIEVAQLVEQNVSRFDTAMESLNIVPVSAAPKASSFVEQVIDWITKLQEKGLAYQVEGTTFFEVGGLLDYGSLCGYDLETMVELSRERGANPDDARKHDPLDFILWQPSASDEPAWDSPFGRGRPGWHIECTVMANQLLGNPVDIHGGGEDLIFPHHECERAQAEGAGVMPFVRHWVHVSHVQFNGQKMSKSLGNLVFVDDLAQTTPPGAIRLMFARHHYREGWSFTPAELQLAEEQLLIYQSAYDHGAQMAMDEVQQYRSWFYSRLDDDLDCPGAIEVIDRLATDLVTPGRSVRDFQGKDLLEEFLGALGVSLRQTAGKK